MVNLMSYCFNLMGFNSTRHGILFQPTHSGGELQCHGIESSRHTSWYLDNQPTMHQWKPWDGTQNDGVFLKHIKLV